MILNEAFELLEKIKLLSKKYPYPDPYNDVGFENILGIKAHELLELYEKVWNNPYLFKREDYIELSDAIEYFLNYDKLTKAYLDDQLKHGKVLSETIRYINNQTNPNKSCCGT